MVRDLGAAAEARHDKPHTLLYLALAVPLRAKIGKLSNSYFYLTISIFGLLLSWFVSQKASCLQSCQACVHKVCASALY